MKEILTSLLQNKKFILAVVSAIIGSVLVAIAGLLGVAPDSLRGSICDGYKAEAPVSAAPVVPLETVK